MTAPDSTIAARVPLELRAELDELVAAGHYKDLGSLIRKAVRELADAHTNGHAHGGLFDPRPGAARRTDPSTSKAAALDVAPRAGSQRGRALAIIAGHGDRGATTDQVIAELEQRAGIEGYPPPAVNGVARRVTDLLQAQAIEPLIARLGGNGWEATTTDYRIRRPAERNEGSVGNGPEVTRPTRHGARAIVYVATAKGRRWLEEVTP